jgi:5-methylcytosine-specific restriction enzyme subunit McrC
VTLRPEYWDRFSEGKAIGVGRIESPKIWDLFASVLVRGVNRLLRRGLDRGYVEIEEEIPGIRGRIVVGDTLRRNQLMFGRATCRFDDLCYDVLHNQIIKATITRLSEADDLHETLRQELYRLKQLFSGVTDVSLANALFRRIQLSRNNATTICFSRYANLYTRRYCLIQTEKAANFLISWKMKK